MGYHHILAPLIQPPQGKNNSREYPCVDRAIYLARRYQCNLSIIAFENKPPEDVDWGMPRQQLVKLRTRHWLDILNPFEIKARQNEIKEVKTEIIWGHPGNNILNTITDRHIDLIVKTCYRGHFLGRRPLSAGDMNLIRQSSIPIWLIPEGTEYQPEINNIAVAIDPENDAFTLNELLLTSAMALSELTAPNGIDVNNKELLHIIHCWQVKGEDCYKRHVSAQHLIEVGRKVQDSHRKHIENLLVKTGLKNHHKVNVVLINDQPSSGICDFINHNPVDLLIIGSHNRTRLERWILGSTAEHTLGQIPCPVLLVRQPC